MHLPDQISGDIKNSTQRRMQSEAAGRREQTPKSSNVPVQYGLMNTTLDSFTPSQTDHRLSACRELHRIYNGLAAASEFPAKKPLNRI
jgi:hypothetical protein